MIVSTASNANKRNNSGTLYTVDGTFFSSFVYSQEEQQQTELQFLNKRV
jgi:negative regulator of genetic competence, sporulation and motility